VDPLLAGVRLSLEALSSASPRAPASPRSSTVTGTVTFDPERVAAVARGSPGPAVRRILKFPGDRVKAGDTLAELESARFSARRSRPVLAARAHAEAATPTRAASRSSRRRACPRNATQSWRAPLRERSRPISMPRSKRVRALGGNASSEIGVLAGDVAHSRQDRRVHVSRGQSVEPSATLFRVADLDRVWIELRGLREGARSHLARRRRRDLAADQPRRRPRGTVAHGGSTIIDRETRSGDVRVVVPNADGSLRPGQSVLAKIHTRTTPAAVLLLPRDAVTSVDGKQTVFVEHDATSVEPRTVTTGARDGARVEITGGLAAGERVAISGVFALKSEIFR